MDYGSRTIRYAGNLLRKGSSDDFKLQNILINYNMVDQLQMGNYYVAAIRNNSGTAKEAAGVTPLQAVTRCLEKHGVTFR